jgi:hypothetical protein
MNDRPDSVMGITAAAMARREMKRERKIETYARAFEQGEMMADMKKNFML